MNSVSSIEVPPASAEGSRDFWRDKLLAGLPAALPRWTHEQFDGVGEHLEPISEELAEALKCAADESGVSLSSLLLTVHAKVLSAMTGEREVSVGYAALNGSAPLPLRMTTEAQSWRAMWQEAHRAESELLSHAEYPVECLRHELGVSRAPFETVVQPKADESGEPAEHVILMVGIVTTDGFALRLCYRTQAFDAACAGRIAGYHLAVLRHIAADPNADHASQSLLCDEEQRFQLEDLAGPCRRLPDQRVHELFEDRVRQHPDLVAAVHGARQWSYRELNARANQLARALLAQGVSAESVVAVVTERNLNWMAAVLAIFKAGGAYLPIEPHFPADRIAKMLSRAQCTVVLTEAGSTSTLDEALGSLPDVETIDIDGAYDRDYPCGNLDTCVTPDQLAYIYFTSGSTGEPKGVMCEQAGMLNHLFAKIDDLDIREREVVAQTAPQCFDISLWQLLAAVLVGGRTLLVEQEAVLDAGRFIEKIVGGRAAVIQVVPSYLEVLMSFLEQQPCELPELRCVSVTGEAVKKELVQRWFETKPEIKLVNAYGLTETSDDTNHEVMDRVPDRDRVPLGRPVNNVSAYIVDERLQLVPLGAPGEIAFSGICVGRGYINDPERTRQAFVADPHCDDNRMYRSGDFGRWLPEGKLEFLGRRDAQVKISGFRIEIGDVENALLQLPGLGDAAVIVAGRSDQSKRLVAFYTGERPLDADQLRERLRDLLPEYMVPAALQWCASLPLTPNGKIDRKALVALAGEINPVEHDGDAPSTAMERRLAATWAQVLGIPKEQIGREDDFFALGGTSLSALKLAVALDRVASFQDLARSPILSEQAAMISARLDKGRVAESTVPKGDRLDPRAATQEANIGEQI